ARGGTDLPDRRDRLDTIHARQLEVHQRDVGRVPLELLDCFLAIARLGHDGHVVFEIDQARDALAQEAVIVDAEQANFWLCHGIRRRRAVWAHGIGREKTGQLGATTSTTVPVPGVLWIDNRASIRSARSSIPSSPRCSW